MVHQRGSTLLLEEPFAFIVEPELRADRCNSCLVLMSNGKKCSKCQYVYYCNKRCQTKAWYIHKHECELIKAVLSKVAMIPATVHLIARILIKLNKLDGENQVVNYGENNCYSRRFKDLMNHAEEIQKDETRMKHYFALIPAIQDFMKDPNLNLQLLFDIFGKICINTYKIIDDELNNVGNGIYLAASSIDHSCDSSAVAIYHGPKIHIRSIKDIPNFKWQNVTIPYIPLMYPTDMRQSMLSGFYFTCTCTRCNSEEETNLMNSMRCPNSNCSEPVSILENADSSKCSRCNAKVTNERIQSYRCAMNFKRDFLLSTQNDYTELTTYETCKLCIEKQADLLHPLNIISVCVLDKMLECCIRLEYLDEAAEYATKLIPGYMRYCGLYNHATGLLYLRAAKLKLLQNKDGEAKNLLRQAKQALMVVYGSDQLMRKMLDDYYNG